MIRGLVVATTLFLTACGTPQTARLATGALTLPPMNTFTRAAPGRTPQSNATLARDFLNLTFTLENGQTLPVFTRFEGPIAVRVLGRAPQSLTRDLDSLLDRLRREARIDIQRVTENTDAQITVQPVTRAQIQRVAPSAAMLRTTQRVELARIPSPPQRPRDLLEPPHRAPQDGYFPAARCQPTGNPRLPPRGNRAIPWPGERPVPPNSIGFLTTTTFTPC